MSKKSAIIKKVKSQLDSYSFNRSIIPFPELASGNVKKVVPDDGASLEEQAQKYMDAYRKAERVVVVNFYTGGGAYKRGILDSIYRGFNPLNP